MDSMEYKISTLKVEGHSLELPFVVFDKGGRFNLPMHKLDSIAHTLYGGDLGRAASLVNSLTSSSTSWLDDLGVGVKAGALELSGSPVFSPPRRYFQTFLWP